MPNTNESDPLGKTAKEPGSKLDAGKIPVARGVLQYFPLALKAVAEISQIGANKYSWRGWEQVPDGINRYTDALGRHLLDEGLNFDVVDSDTGKPHIYQTAWNALARLELYLREQRKYVGQVSAIHGDPRDYTNINSQLGRLQPITNYK